MYLLSLEIFRKIDARHSLLPIVTKGLEKFFFIKIHS